MKRKMTHKITRRVQRPFTAQTLFTKVATHLLTQNAKAKDEDDGQCRYRTPEGLSCAIGCLIPEARYRPAFEGVGLGGSDMVKVERILRAAGISAALLPLAATLQNVHDDDEVGVWPVRLEQVAKYYGLRMPEVTR